MDVRAIGVTVVADLAVLDRAIAARVRGLAGPRAQQVAHARVAVAVLVAGEAVGDLAVSLTAVAVGVVAVVAGFPLVDHAVAARRVRLARHRVAYPRVALLVAGAHLVERELAVRLAAIRGDGVPIIAELVVGGLEHAVAAVVRGDAHACGLVAHARAALGVVVARSAVGALAVVVAGITVGAVAVVADLAVVDDAVTAQHRDGRRRGGGVVRGRLLVTVRAHRRGVRDGADRHSGHRDRDRRGRARLL
jgi:hypothetical protein